METSPKRIGLVGFLTRKNNRLSVGFLFVLISMMVGGHLVFLNWAPVEHGMGDEGGYVSRSLRDARSGATSLLPGKLPFGHRPPLPIRIFTQLAIPDGPDQKVPGRKAMLSKMQLFHIFLLIPILICTYAQGRLLRLGPFGALVAPTMLGIFPWFGFYIQSGFADITRTTITMVALTLILAHMVTKRYSYLVMGGLIGGFAILSRVSTYHILLVAAGIIVVGAWMDHRASPTRVRFIRSVSPGVLLAVLISLVVTPQLIRNANDGHGFRIAANTWRQLEFGIKRVPPSASPEMKEAYTQKIATRHYNEGYRNIADPELRAEARSYPSRERRAKARTLEFISSLPLATLVTRQTEKWIEFFFQIPSYFETGVDKVRWGDHTEWIKHFVTPARLMWYGIIGLTVIALPIVGWRSRGWLLVSFIVVYYFAAMWVVGFVMRFSVLFMPWLCLMAAAALVEFARFVHPARHETSRHGDSN